MDRRTLSHDDLADDLPAYVLGVLDDEACDAMDAHIAACPVCQAERQRLQATIGALGTLAPQVDPPASLRDRVLAEIVRPGDAEPPREPLTLPAGPAMPRWVGFALAAAAVLIIGLAGWAALLSRDLARVRSDLAALQARQDETTAVLADATRAIPLIADNAPEAYGTLYVAPEDEKAVLVVEKLPPTPRNRVYQVWLIQGSSRDTGAVFTVDQSGQATVLIDAPGPLAQYDAMGITEEPGPSGSPGPTTERLVGCRLS